jgi:hypothetical protein
MTEDDAGHPLLEEWNRSDRLRTLALPTYSRLAFVAASYQAFSSSAVARFLSFERTRIPWSFQKPVEFNKDRSDKLDTVVAGSWSKAIVCPLVHVHLFVMVLNVHSCDPLTP